MYMIDCYHINNVSYFISALSKFVNKMDKKMYNSKQYCVTK